MNKVSWLRFIVILIAVVLGGLGLFLFASPYGHHVRLRSRTEKIAHQIEAYRKQHGTLPLQIEDLGLHEDEIYYERQGHTNYVLWFGRELGESSTYYSSNKMWTPF